MQSFTKTVFTPWSKLRPRRDTFFQSVLSSSSRTTNGVFLFSTTTTTTNNTNYFQLLQQPQSFSISLPLLKESYQSQMKILHPDKHTLQSPEKQQEVADLSSKVIRGYEVLKDDYQRALHLLDLHGESLEQEGTTASMNMQGEEQVVDVDVLLMVMEIREQIDRLVDGDSSGDHVGGDTGRRRRELRQLLDENQKRIVETVELLKDAFGRNDWVTAKKLVATLQYWNRIKETIVEKL